MNGLYKEKGVRFFAASNTKDGFVSYFDEIFRVGECDRIYILKGGPGCGKSTFMKKLGEISEEKGYSCEYFHCSSDPESLDGIIIKEKRVAVIDGTSPHAVEPKLSGVREIIIDLGRAWDTDKLFELGEDIERLSLQKKKHYDDCYKFLYSKNVMDSLVYNLVFPYILFDKPDKTAKRLVDGIFKRHKKRGKSNVKTRLISAFSSCGKIRLSTFEDMAKMCVFVKEPFRGSCLPTHFLSAVFEFAKNYGTEIYVSYSSEKRAEINALYFPEIGVSVSAYDEKLVAECDRIGKKCRIINSARFVDTKTFSHLNPLRKFYNKLSENMENHALNSIEMAGKVHSEIEKIYRQCTNYTAVENITNEYINKILNN